MPDIITVKREDKQRLIIDVMVSGNCRIFEKEQKKELDQEFSYKVARLWVFNMYKYLLK